MMIGPSLAASVLLSLSPELFANFGAMPSPHAPPSVPGTSIPSSDKRADVRLIADTTAPQPGKPFLLGVDFTLKGNWHIYWHGTNDSGRAPTIKLKLPDGWKHGPIHYPAPKRHVGGDIVLDHIYEKHVTLLIEVTPSDAAITAPISISADLTYLICDDVCEIERCAASLTLDPSAEPPADAIKAIHAAQKQLPKPLSTASTHGHVVTQLQEKSQDGKGIARIGFKVEGASRIEFFPSVDAPTIANLIKAGSASGDTLWLKLESPADDTQTLSNQFKGSVLSITTQSGEPPAYYSLD
jgi:DsbC/DsbD-like thiol-disulfide interchange protein